MRTKEEVQLWIDSEKEAKAALREERMQVDCEFPIDYRWESGFFHGYLSALKRHKPTVEDIEIIFDEYTDNQPLHGICEDILRPHNFNKIIADILKLF